MIITLQTMIVKYKTGNWAAILYFANQCPIYVSSRKKNCTLSITGSNYNILTLRLAFCINYKTPT